MGRFGIGGGVCSKYSIHDFGSGGEVFKTRSGAQARRGQVYEDLARICLFKPVRGNCNKGGETDKQEHILIFH